MNSNITSPVLTLVLFFSTPLFAAGTCDPVPAFDAAVPTTDAVVSAIGAGMQETPESMFTSEQEYLFDIFKNRRSVRKFKSTPIPREHLLKILDMARCAPTSGNQQPWKFFVIQDRDKLNRLKEECMESRMKRAEQQGISDPAKLDEIRNGAARYYGDYLSAPVYVVVLVDTCSKYPSYNIYDGALAGGYLMLAARALGYGTVFSQDSIPYGLIQKVFDIPEHYERICFTPIGVPFSWPEAKGKKPLDELVVFDEFIKGENYDPPVIRKEIQLEPKALEAVVGKYAFNADLDLTVTRKGEKMFIQVTGQPEVEIFPETAFSFFLKVTDAQITFNCDDQGKVTGLTWHQGGENTPAPKVIE